MANTEYNQPAGRFGLYLLNWFFKTRNKHQIQPISGNK